MGQVEVGGWASRAMRVVCGKFSKKKVGHGRDGSDQAPRTPKKTMTRKTGIKSVTELKALVAEDEDFLRPIVQIAVQEFLEAEPSGAR